MSIISGWLEWAIRHPGPAAKVYPQRSAQTGLVVHSVEGWLAGALGELNNPERSASWHLTNAIDGKMYQHYPFSASCWASGNQTANTRYIAVESEGLAGTPLNDLQVANMLRLAEDLDTAAIMQLERGVTLFEHNEVAVKWSPNSGPTACPSHRYDPFFAALLKEPEEPMGMTPEEKRIQDDLVANMAQVLSQLLGQKSDGVPNDFEDSGYVTTDDNHILTLAEINRQLHTLHASGPGKLMPHTHTPGGVA